MLGSHLVLVLCCVPWSGLGCPVWWVRTVPRSARGSRALRGAPARSLTAVPLMPCVCLCCAVGVERARGHKCSRCWNYSEALGTHQDYPDLCERCTPIVLDMGFVPQAKVAETAAV